jgi:transcriptional regulator with XRE-family HTH domain
MSKEDEIRKREFGRRLQKQLNAKGWTQAELARRVARAQPSFLVGRDSVSKWVRAKVLPLPPALEAICKVLEIKTTDLLPERATPISEPYDHSACGEREMRLQEALEKAQEEARKAREEASKDRAFYHGQMAALQEQMKHLIALIPVWSSQHVDEESVCSTHV